MSLKFKALGLYVPAVNYKAYREKNMENSGCYSGIIWNEVVKGNTNKRVAVETRFEVKLTSFSSTNCLIVLNSNPGLQVPITRTTF